MLEVQVDAVGEFGLPVERAALELFHVRAFAVVDLGRFAVRYDAEVDCAAVTDRSVRVERAL